jgi:hypothetical protein
MKETCNKPSKKYCVTTETNFNSEDVLLGAAYNAMRCYDNNESLVITNNETGEVLFQYVNGAVKWMDGDFARKLFTRFAG